MESQLLKGLRSSRALGIFVFVAVLLSGFSFYYLRLGADLTASLLPGHATDASAQPTKSTPPLDRSHLRETVRYFEDYPFTTPFREKFGDAGARTRIVKDWLVRSEETEDAEEKAVLAEAVEQAIVAIYPFLQNPPSNPASETPLADLRSSFESGSAGIVITTGDATLRYSSHLIVSLRSVLNSTLPIQIVYAGDRDLSANSRMRLARMVTAGPALEFIDMNTVFDNTTLHFHENHGGWAMKAFAVLGSRFERVMLIDADAVFLQPPEVFLEHPAFLRTGTLLFHDRLLWKGEFADRHSWWRSQIRHPSPALHSSLVWTEDYAEEGDSGVVVLDKSRVDVLMGLLHISWQNSFPVRESITYKITYGDKETWWFGLELAGATYEFEKHYGAIVGWEETDEEGRRKVCSFVIAHVDEKDQLLWYNGGLLKNKALEEMKNVYQVPQKWMVDAEWKKGIAKSDMSCMVGGEVHDLTPKELDTLAQAIEQAKKVDADLERPWRGAEVTAG
ncbi:glycosyltransferase family 71 protein [Bombardia bombarda]|uniref:Glycosyltransferase family 71 protein n=1 Tax=Bombardia bombarda TaxID=252184 RepID=A0AA39W4U8_9PEZI|nr:glycosyltransferase family 71 protein [Bombardia bombarda]